MIAFSDIKMDRLTELGINVTMDMKARINNMCNLSEGIFEKGFQEGREQGREEGREQGREEERKNTEREKERADRLQAELDRLKGKINQERM